jgi:ribosomal protein S6--L-glutamate ligase
MRLGVVFEWLNPTMEAMLARIAARGIAVRLVEPTRRALRVADIAVDCDLYLVKGGDARVTSLAGALHALGARTLNPFPTLVVLRDKLVVTRMLHAAGVPVPETWLGVPGDLEALLAEGPLVAKPVRGSRGRGVRIVRRAEDAAGHEPLLFQRHHPRDDELDRKLFVVGGRVFGVKRPWPLARYEDKIGEPFEPDDELRAIALRVGDTFGVAVYGLDVVVSRGRPWVVDVNTFGSFMGVPGAAEVLADHVERELRR